MKHETESFGARLKQLRKEKRLSMKAVADAIDVPLTTYREWEYGRAIQGEPYLKLAQIFGVSVFRLLGGSTAHEQNVSTLLDQIEENLRELRMKVQSLF